jgi:ankyrin repeat protein
MSGRSSRQTEGDLLRRFGEAVLARDVKEVRRLLDAGLPVNALDPSNKQSLLLLCTGVGTPELLELLIERGADLRAVDKTGTGALGRTVRANRIDLAELLLKHGADVNHRNRMGQSPLFHTLGTDDRRDSMIRLLLRHGADPDLADNDGDTPRTQAQALKHIQDYTDLLPPRE